MCVILVIVIVLVLSIWVWVSCFSFCVNLCIFLMFVFNWFFNVSWCLMCFFNCVRVLIMFCMFCFNLFSNMLLNVFFFSCWIWVSNVFNCEKIFCLVVWCFCLFLVFERVCIEVMIWWLSLVIWCVLIIEGMVLLIILCLVLVIREKFRMLISVERSMSNVIVLKENKSLWLILVLVRCMGKIFLLIFFVWWIGLYCVVFILVC